jgi:hypothetical protein
LEEQRKRAAKICRRYANEAATAAGVRDDAESAVAVFRRMASSSVEATTRLEGQLAERLKRRDAAADEADRLRAKAAELEAMQQELANKVFP